MQFVKLVIPGQYWDSFIYKGKLYLFEVAGLIRTIKWQDLIEEWSTNEDLKLVIECAFLRSDYLYLSDVSRILKDPDVRGVIRDKFARLSKMNLEVTLKMLDQCELGKQENRVFPHADVEIYMDQMYTGGAHGLFRASCNQRTKHPVSSKPQRLWDGPVLSMSASYRTLAIAAGSHGLYEQPIGQRPSDFSQKKPSCVSELPCRECSWAYYSLFASSDSSGYLAAYSRNTYRSFGRVSSRQFDHVTEAEAIFQSSGYSWGEQDKLCQAKSGEVRVVEYKPWHEEPLRDLGAITFEDWKGDIVSATTASFGMIVELDEAIVVFPSVGSSVTIPGEPVNWRVFPRSMHYENHLHVCYDDRLEIFSFNHDYLVDQASKISGYSVRPGGRRSSSVRFGGLAALDGGVL